FTVASGRRCGRRRTSSGRAHDRADRRRDGEAMTVFAANGPNSFIWWDWVDRHRELIQNATFEHLRLTLIAVVVCFVFSAALAVIALRFRWTYAPITWVTGFLYTIPSLALFVLLVPLTGFTTL